MKYKKSKIIYCILFSILPVVFGFIALGSLVAAIFALGYIGGLVCWLFMKREFPFKAIKLPYWLTWLAFALLHKPEEKYMKFFEAVSEITGIPVPNPYATPVLLLLITGVLPWLFVPILINKKLQIGYYFGWTFFASMAFTELAHFLIFPFLQKSAYSYFPGMISALILIPFGFWGLYRLAFYRATNNKDIKRV